MATPSWTNTFGGLSGDQPASKIDDNFAQATQVTSLAISPQTPLIPVVGGAVGTDGYAAAADHQHPPQEATIRTVSGTTGAISDDDDGLVIETSNGSSVTLTFDASVSEGKSGLICQVGAGQITLAVGGTGNLRQASGLTKSRAQWAQISWRCRANPGTAPEIVLSGDMSS